MEHFSEMVVKNGWKRVDFIKSEENTISAAKDIHGICCPDCQKDIEGWKEGNPRHHKKAENTTKLMTMFVTGAALVNAVEQQTNADNKLPSPDGL
jgi:hypothetical protein